MENFILLSLLVFIAGFIDSIAGGGGLITIPSYLNYGLSENLLLGTNKFSSSLGTSMAVFKFLRELDFEKKYLLFISFFSIIGSIFGAISISLIPQELVKYIIIFSIPLVSIFLLINKSFGLSDLSFSLSAKKLYFKSALISLGISFYDGILGPGTGTFLAISYTQFCGYDLLKATALSKFTNLLSNISALITFMILGKVDYKLGLFMGIFSIFGNYLGSHFALKRGINLIKTFVFLISNAILAKIIYDLLNAKI
jgi:hypothetical protein